MALLGDSYPNVANCVVVVTLGKMTGVVEVCGGGGGGGGVELSPAPPPPPPPQAAKQQAADPTINIRTIAVRMETSPHEWTFTGVESARPMCHDALPIII